MNSLASQPNCVVRVPAKDAYSTSGEALMGRQAANEGFLTSWFRYSGHQEFWCLARWRDEAKLFAQVGETVHAESVTKPVFRWIAQSQMHRAAAVGTVFAPGPQVADLAWVRRRDAKAVATDFSIVGMTHTSCTLYAQDALANMLTAPVYPWDAQICPSVSVQAMVKRLLDDESTWLRERLGASRLQTPALPVIPLGVDYAAFNPPQAQKAALRESWRARWELGASDVCVLYMGRLDLRTKANLYPMLDALQIAAQQIKATKGPRLHLVLCGWFASEWDREAITNGVKDACPDVRVVFEDGRLPAARRAVWHAADVFTSLVDNIQETFGLTPIEAMAAGLPVVVSDYDGYRESVRDGIDGIRVRTWQPAAGEGADFADGYSDLTLSYRDYASRVSGLIGVDIAAAAHAYSQLALDAGLRARMGAAGRIRAAQDYDWARLIPRYIRLFEDLQRLRASEVARANRDLVGDSAFVRCHAWGLRHPRRSDPFHSFAHYPTETLAGASLLCPGPMLPQSAADQERALVTQLGRPIYAGVCKGWEPKPMLNLLRQVARQPDGVAWVFSPQGTHDLGVSQRQVAWLIKTGLIHSRAPGTVTRDTL